jgi:DNA-binding IclR family transcriptional regulator
LDFIELFAEEKRPLSLSDISRLLGIPMSSCFDVIRSMQECGFIHELGQRAGFYPTQRIVQLANAISENDPIKLRAEIALRALRDEFDESVALSQASGRQARYLVVFEPSHHLRFTVRVGDQLRSLHATSVGKAILANLPPEELDEELSKPLAPLTPRTITDPEALRRDLAEGKARGLFVNREESALTVTTLTAGFRWYRSDYFVTIAGPIHRMDEKFDQAATRLREVCAELEMSDGASSRKAVSVG